MVVAGSIGTTKLFEYRPFDHMLCEYSQYSNNKSCAKFTHDYLQKSRQKVRMPSKIGSEIIAKWLEESLASAGVNQSQLGRAIGLSSQKVNRTLKGKREMTAEEMIRTSSFLKAPIPKLPDADPIIIAHDNDLDDANESELNPADDEIDRFYEIAFKTALQIEQEEHEGNMPLKSFISAVAVGYRNLLRNRG